MAVATERRVPMAASRLVAGTLLVVAACGYALAQDPGQVPDASSLPSSSTSSSSSSSHHRVLLDHRSGHYVRVPDDDAPAPPAELTQAEAAIEKQNYAAAESLLHKVVERDARELCGMV